ncbi:MAG: STAS domain-containing protein [Anaerolineales bacterium]|nr:STAS domain-containing protein [Anaerolineales bacterium]
MSILTEFHENTARIRLSGAIDYSTQDAFQEENNKALGAAHITEILVDLDEVTFLDSSGIRALLTLQKNAVQTGKALVILNCRHPVREIFEIGGFDRMFTFR